MQSNGLEQRPLLMGEKVKKLPLFLRFSYGFGHVFNDLCAAMWFSYTLFYLQIILQMKATTAGILVMIGQVADALATPLAGWAVDKFGNRKKWHFTGTVMVTISFPLVFTICEACESIGNIGGVLYYSIAIVIFQIGWATVQISHLSIIPNLTSESNHRSELTAIRYTAAVCSSVAVYIVTWAVLDSNSTSEKIGPDDYFKFREIIMIICGLGIFSSLIFYYGVECKENGSEISHLDGELVKTIQNIPTSKIFSSPLIYQVSLLYVASRLYMTLNLVYMPLYLDERVSLNSTSTGEDIRESLASVPLLSFLASFLASLILKYKTKYCGNKVAYLIGSVISLLACIWIGFLIGPDSNTIHIYAVAILIGTGSSTTMVSSLCLTAEMIGLNSDKGASVYSIVTFTDKLICGVAVVIVEHMKCANKTDCPEYYRYVLAFVSGGAVLLGLVMLSTLCLSKAETFIKQETRQ